MKFKFLSVMAAAGVALFAISCTKDVSPSEREQKKEEEKKDTSVHVTGIRIIPESQTFCVGDTVQMVALIEPSNASDKTVLWNVEDPATVKINREGLAVAVKTGTTRIIAKSRDSEQMAYSEVTVVLPPESITLDPHELCLIKGESSTLSAHIYPEEASSLKTVDWTTSDSNVLTVSEQGVISAAGPGFATVTAEIRGTELRDSCTVEVRDSGIDVEAIILNTDFLLLYEGQDASLYATAYPENASYNKYFEWESSDEGIATVDENGRISAKSAGSCIIKVTSYGATAEAECTLTVKENSQFRTGYDIENSAVSQYLDAALSTYTNADSTSIVTSYCKTASAYKENNREDIPSIFKVSWFGMADEFTCCYSDGSVCYSQTFPSSTTNTFVRNLAPEHYIYKVNNSVRTSGILNVTGRRRMLKISDTYSNERGANFRDLGGIRTDDGRSIRYGMIFRGSSIDKLSNAEKSILVDELGIKLDVDMRDALSGKLFSPLGVDISNERYSVKFTDLAKAQKISRTLTDIMTYVSAGKPVYIHSQTGSDRTGYICMILESLLGAPLSECEIDYELSSFAGGVTSGPRTKRSGMALEFVNMFVKGKHEDYFAGARSYDEVPQAVEDYVVNTLGISGGLVNSFREAMLK